MKYNFLKVLLSFILIYKVYSFDKEIDYVYTNYTISDVEAFKVETAYCQEYSSTAYPRIMETKTGENFTACDYDYLCPKNGNCLIFHRKNLISISDYSYVTGHKYTGENEEKILLACNKKSIKNDNCTTEKCVVTEDCLSKNCVNEICIINKEEPIYNCGTVKENSELKVKCLLNYEETCKEDAECTGISKCNKDHICRVESKGYTLQSKTYLIISLIIVFVFNVLF